MKFDHVNRGCFFNLGIHFEGFDSPFKLHKLGPHGFRIKPIGHGVNNLLNAAIRCRKFFFTAVVPFAQFSPDFGPLFVEGFHKMVESFFRKQLPLEALQNFCF